MPRAPKRPPRCRSPTSLTRAMKNKSRCRPISQAALDADKAALDQAKARLAEAEAALANAKLPTGRDDAIRAAEADAIAAKAALAQAQWRLDQKKLVAPSDAFVFDTLYRPGEFIDAGQPVVSLLPAANIRVRFFVPATALAQLPAGTAVHIKTTGAKDEYPRAYHLYIAAGRIFAARTLQPR